MGIRFYCPNGHKLNVKEFQAGRKGICPYCAAKIQIPTQSTRPATKGKKRARDENEVTVEETEGDAKTSPAPAPLTANTTLLRETVPVATPPTKAPVPSPAVSPVVVGTAATPVAPAASTEPSAAAPGSTAAAVPPGVSGSTTAGGPPVAQPATSVQPSPAPAPSAPVAAPPPPTAAAAPDAIAEAPESIWYVRPPSGGQFGPAAGDIMRGWLSEGRVSADSLVWREGWRDWQEAGSVFPQLRADSAIAFLDTVAATEPLAMLPTASSRSHKPHQDSKRSEFTIIMLLVLAVALLFVIFIWVLMK